jgi:hypothetical protein
MDNLKKTIPVPPLDKNEINFLINQYSNKKKAKNFIKAV